MKEIIQKIVIAVLVVVVVGSVAGFVLKSDEPQTTTQDVLSTDTPASDSQVTPDNSVNATTGNQVGEPSQQGTEPSQQGTEPSQQGTQPSQQGTEPSQQGTQPSQQGTQPSQQGTQPSQQQQNPSDSQGTTSAPDVQTTYPTTDSYAPTQPSDTTTPQGTTQPPQPANKIDAYQQIFRSGRFIMKVNDPELGPVTMAMSGNKMFVEASMEGLTLKMLYDGDKPDEDNPGSGTWYIIIDKIKKYSPMPSNMLGNMNVEDLTKNFANDDNNAVYTKSVETVNGEQLDCESCVDSNGNTTKYYFRGDTLVRSDSISPSGEVSTTEFQEINANVDDSMFIIPSGYAKWDISWLIDAMG